MVIGRSRVDIDEVEIDRSRYTKRSQLITKVKIFPYGETENIGTLTQTVSDQECRQRNVIHPQTILRF